MNHRPSIITWLEAEELPDLYRLLGRRRLDPDVDGLKAAVKTAARELLPYQNHADAGKAQRAMNMLTQLGRVEGLLSDQRRLAEVNRQLLSDLTAQGVARFGNGTAQWTPDTVRAWLEHDEQISPAAVGEALATVCAALRPAEVAPKPVRVFAAQAPAAPDMPEIVPVAAFCPECGFSVAEGAVICIACGYDFRTGQKIVPQTSRSSLTIRPPSGAKASSHTAKKTRETVAARGALASNTWLAKVGFTAAAALVALISGAVWLSTTRDREPAASGDEATVAAVGKKVNAADAAAPDQVTMVKDPASNENASVDPFAEDPKNSNTGESPTAASASMPNEDLPSPIADTVEAQRAFDRAYKKAVGATPADFDKTWERALQLAPNAESRRLVHHTQIAELIKGPTPLPAARLEKLCTAYDLLLADAKNVGERLSSLESLMFALRQKKSVELALVRYASLRGATSGDELHDAVIRRLTQECFSGVTALPVDERWDACKRVIELVGDDQATRLAAYRVLAADPAVMAQVSLEKLWEVFDLVLATTPEGNLATGYVRALVDQVRRRGANKEAVQHYQSLSEDAGKPFARLVLVALAQPQLATRQSPPPAGPAGPPSSMGPRGPMPGRPATPADRSTPGAPLGPANNPPPPEDPDEPDEDIAQLKEYIRLLDDLDYCSKAREAELEKMYDFVVEKAGQTLGAQQFAGQLLDALIKKRKVNEAIRHYEQKLRKNKNSLAALQFLALAYGWRAGDNFTNQTRAAKDLALRKEMLDRLAGVQPASRGKKTSKSRFAP